MVMDERVRLGAPPAGLQQEWARIKCSTRRAYGCGEHGQRLLDGLTLYIRLVRPLCVSTSLYIHLSDDALRGIRVEFGEGDGPPIQIDGNTLRANGAVSTTNDEVIVLVLVFQLRHFHTRVYYIVYDAIDGSLTMLPAPPPPSSAVACTPKPLAVPLDRGDGGAPGYELIFMSRKLVPPLPGQGYNTYEDVLYRWTRGARPSGNAGPWQVQGRRLPKEVGEFVVEAMFAMQGKVFFADLSQGLVYCDLPASDDSVVDFNFIPLPAEAPIDVRWAKVQPEDMGPMNWYRTMSCAGGSIKFVCIDRSAARPEDANVIVFTLDLPKRKWTIDMEYRTIELWKFLGFQKKGLPQTVPRCPLLMSDNTLSLLLPSMRKKQEDPSEDYVCNFKKEEKRIKLKWFVRLENCSYSEPIILDSDFFKAIDPPSNVQLRKTIFL